MTGKPNKGVNTPQTKLISTPSGVISGAALIACATAAAREAFLQSLTEGELRALPYLFEFWALDHQLPPRQDWSSWVILGGRGAGKTRAGAEWVRSMVEGARPGDPGRARRVALVGETIEQAREVMVFGESGILACSPPDRRPEWISGRKKLIWPNGAEATVYSAFEPEALRGPQFDAAWADELGKWRKGQEAWDMLQFGLRLGTRPQVCVTTTPRNAPVLKDLLARDSSVRTHAPTEANRAYLADSFLEEVRARYAGTRLGRQELDGVMLTDVAGGLWSGPVIDAALVEVLPVMDRIVVAVDPPVSGHNRSDDCGIVVVGVTMQGPPQDWRAYVIEDATVSAASPLDWAKAAVAAMQRHGAERLVAEVNQGGAMVETVVRQIDPLVPFRAVHASKGKAARAEPVAALYEQGRVKHVRGLQKLEEQMGQMTVGGFMGKGSPDRVDALVWAIQDAMIDPAQMWRRPRLRAL